MEAKGPRGFPRGRLYRQQFIIPREGGIVNHFFRIFLPAVPPRFFAAPACAPGRPLCDTNNLPFPGRALLRRPVHKTKPGYTERPNLHASLHVQSSKMPASNLFRRQTHAGKSIKPGILPAGIPSAQVPYARQNIFRTVWFPNIFRSGHCISSAPHTAYNMDGP